MLRHKQQVRKSFLNYFLHCIKKKWKEQEKRPIYKVSVPGTVMSTLKTRSHGNMEYFDTQGGKSQNTNKMFGT